MSQTPPPKLALDLSKRHDTFRAGDITVILTWMQHNGRPCMVLIPAFTKLHFDRITPCIIPIDNAWAWAEETGDGAHAAITSIQFAACLGFNTGDPRGAFRVTSVIREYLAELLRMPPKPDFDQVVVAHTHLLNTSTGKVIEGEVSEDV